MPGVSITGGPGAGKTTLLAELARRGFATITESARSIIAERLAQGLPPRPEPAAFAREILRRDTRNYEHHVASDRWTFYDRGVIEAIAMVHETAPLPSSELTALLSRYAMHREILVLPPWETIYVTDAERDHTFAHAQAVHGQFVTWYRSCGYQLIEVPCLTVQQRAEFVIQVLTAAGDA
jgi:predicted ATPase